MYKVGLFIVLLNALIGCKPKSEPTEDIGTPVFLTKGSIANTQITLAAGLNNYFLSTNYFSPSRGLLQFTGKLAPSGCLQCGNALTITIRNYTNNPNFQIDSADIPTDYNYYFKPKDIEQYYILKCYADAVGNGTPNISWNFDNEVFSTEFNPIIRFDESKICNITSSAIFPNNCFSILTQPAYLTPSRVGKSANFNTNFIDTFTLLFNSIPINNSATVNWDFGDGQTAQGTITQHTFANSGIYKVCMESIVQNDTMQFCKNVATRDITYCINNFNFETSFITDSMHYSFVTVEWQDANGVKYSSENIAQPSLSSFNIIKSENYQLNSNGQKTRKYTFKLNCLASDGTQTIELKNIEGTMGYAYP